MGNDRHGCVASRERSSRHQHGLRRCRLRKSRHDFVVEPRCESETRRNIVYGRRRIALPHHKRHAGRSRFGNYSTESGRLFPNRKRRWTRRLQTDYAGSGLGTRNGRFRKIRIRFGFQISQSFHHSRRRCHRTNDGESRFAFSPTPTHRRGNTPSAPLGHTRQTGRTYTECHHLSRTRSGPHGGKQSAFPSQISRDREE